MLTSSGHGHFDLVQVFHVLVGDFVNEATKEGIAPLICHHCLLKYLMQQGAVDQRRGGFAGRLHAILEDGSSHAGKTICYYRGRYQLIWVKNENVLVVVNNALPRGLEEADDMYKSLWVDGSINPIAPQMNRLHHAASFYLDQQYLSSSVYHSLSLSYHYYLPFQ